MRVEITDGVIPAAEIVAGIKAGTDGAVCVFDGIVRDNTRGRKTLHLDYEAYREMALEQMRALAGEAVVKFGVRDVTLVHRLGRLGVGETSVLVVVASAHRGAAFDACRWLIDTLKKTVPIWKKEQFVDGAIWADGEPFPGGLGVHGSAEAEARSAGGSAEKSGRASLDNPPFAKSAKDGPPGSVAGPEAGSDPGSVAGSELGSETGSEARSELGSVVPGEGGRPSDDTHISESRYGAPGFDGEPGSVGGRKLEAGE